MLDRGIPRQHYLIYDTHENLIGEVTSGTQSPSLGKAIGMGYVKSSNSSIGEEFYIQIRKNRIKAKVVKLPFVL